LLISNTKQKKFNFQEIAIKEIFEEQSYSPEENEQRFQQELGIMWTISSHPNIITLVGYSDNPKCIITKVNFFFCFSFF